MLIKSIEKEIQFKLATRGILDSPFDPNIGFLNGKAGMALYLYQLSLNKDFSFFDKISYSLIEEIIERIDASVPLNFEHGIAGIGYCLDYLFQEGFVDNSSMEIFSDFDELIFKSIENTAWGFNIRIGISGIALYLCNKLQNRDISNNYRENITNVIFKIIDKISELLDNDFELDLSLWDGLSGVLLVLYNIEKKAKLNLKNLIERILLKIEKILYNYTSYNIEILSLTYCISILSSDYYINHYSNIQKFINKSDNNITDFLSLTDLQCATLLLCITNIDLKNDSIFFKKQNLKILRKDYLTYLESDNFENHFFNMNFNKQESSIRSICEVGFNLLASQCNRRDLLSILFYHF